jgi:hypothetical protein
MCTVNQFRPEYYFVPHSTVRKLLCNGSGCVMGIIFAWIIDMDALTMMMMVTLDRDSPMSNTDQTQTQSS